MRWGGRRLGRGAALAAVAIVVAPAAAAGQPGPLVTVPPLDLPSRPATATAAQAGTGQVLTGTFRLTAGACEGRVTGTRFRMIQPGGSASGPFVSSGDSPCDDDTVTPLRAGRDGGLVTGTYQSHPSPAFSATGGGRADRITAPQRFFGVDFATATNQTDPQTGARVAAPVVRVDAAGRLSGDLRAFSAAWNTQHFNQGAPKPDGSTPGLTAGPTGTYDASTGRFVLEWTSQIVGGPFNNFTGQWHLEGAFVAADGGRATPTSDAASGTPSAAGGSGTASAAGSGVTAGAAASVASRTTGGAPLANTGPPFGSAAGLALVGAGAASLAALRRTRSRP